VKNFGSAFTNNRERPLFSGSIFRLLCFWWTHKERLITRTV